MALGIFTSPLRGSLNILPLFTSISKNNCLIFTALGGEYKAKQNHCRELGVLPKFHSKAFLKILEYPSADDSACSRLSDSGEDAKEKGTRKVGGAEERKKEGRESL